MINRRTFIRGAAVSTVAAVAGTSVFAYGSDRHDLETTTVPLTVGLGSPLRLVVVGDIHFDPLYEEAYLMEIGNRVTALNADMVVFTGDYTTNSLDRLDDLGPLLGRMQSRLGSVAIVGNHDVWTGTGKLTRLLKKNDIRLLQNSFMALPGEEKFFVTGLDSYWAGRPDPSVIDRTPSDARHLLLVHEPDPFAELDDKRIKLQISGHTHGGQVRVPLVGALRLPKWGKIYQEGLFSSEARYLYVNRGVGTLMPHVRFDCRPEITVLELS